jgi:hypothetical protein
MPLRPALLTAALLMMAGTAAAQDGGEGSLLRRHEAMLVLDYQSISVPGDAPIDLLGFHVFHRVSDALYLGAGVLAPHFKGEYGGFMAFDLAAHWRKTLSGPLFATAGVAAGGGGGGRSMAQSTLLSGTGGFARAYAGLGWDFGRFSVGANVSRLKFKDSAIDGTQANLFVEIPYRWLSAPFDRRGETLPPADDRRAATEGGESMFTLTLDNVHQIDPQAEFKGVLRLAELQYAHFFWPDTYWFGALGVGYRGLPIYNQVIGGVGHRLRLSPKVTLYGQLGVGSGGWAPERIDTGSGFLVYPRLAAEYALTDHLGLSFSVGHLAAPKGSSRNHTWGLALTHHLRPGGTGSAPAVLRGLRVGLFHQTGFSLSYNDIERPPLQMIGLQVDTPLGEHWYLPLQAAVAYTDYLGYPGYGELLAGLGLQTRAGRGERWQVFGQLMGGANVHGTAVKASAGLRYRLDERLALQANLGRIEARNASGRRFTAGTLNVGVDFSFAVPTR